MKIFFIVGLVLGIVGACTNKILDALLKYYQKKLGAAKAAKAEPNELDELVRQERITQAVRMMPIVALNLPLDVKLITVIFHYEDGQRLSMDCGRRQRMEVEP